MSMSSKLDSLWSETIPKWFLSEIQSTAPSAILVEG